MTSSAVSTAARVASEIPGFPFRTRLTVASLTPACFATSASLPAMPQDYCKILQMRSAGQSLGPGVVRDRFRPAPPAGVAPEDQLVGMKADPDRADERE